MVKRVTNMHKLTDLVGNGKKTVKAGIFSDATYPDGVNVAQVAFWDEYGTKTARPRSFFRDAVSSNRDKWKETLFQAMKYTDFDIDKALAILGEQMSDDIKNSILNGAFEPNSPVTLLLKDRFPMNPEEITFDDFLQAIHDVDKGMSPSGSNNKPLIWTGTLLKSIGHKVDDES